MTIPCSLDPLGSAEQNPFKKGQIIVSASASAAITSIVLHRGLYKIELVGGGGGQGGFATASGYAFGSGGGGSGSCFVGTLRVKDLRQTFDYYAGHVGSTNRGYVGVGTDGTNSWISEQGNLNVRLYCNSAGTGSKGWDGYGTGGTIVDAGSFVSKYITNTEVRHNGLNGTAGGVVGNFGTGGASLLLGYGRGAGPKGNDGTAGFVRISYLGAY